MSAPLYLKELDPIKVSIESNKYSAAKHFVYNSKDNGNVDNSFEVNTGYSFAGEWKPLDPTGTVTF